MGDPLIHYGRVSVDAELVERFDPPADPPVRTSAQPAPAPADALVEQWFLDTFHNLSGLAAGHWQHFRDAADRLKALLRAAAKGD